MFIRISNEDLFRQIAPRWYYIIKNAKNFTDLYNGATSKERQDGRPFILDMEYFSACIVGEFYCLTQSYEIHSHSDACGKCMSYAVTLGDVVKTGSMADDLYREKYKEEFTYEFLLQEYDGVHPFDDMFRSNAGIMSNTLDMLLEHMLSCHNQLVNKKKSDYKQISENIDKVIILNKEKSPFPPIPNGDEIVS